MKAAYPLSLLKSIPLAEIVVRVPHILDFILAV